MRGRGRKEEQRRKYEDLRSFELEMREMRAKRKEKENREKRRRFEKRNGVWVSNGLCVWRQMETADEEEE